MTNHTDDLTTIQRRVGLVMRTLFTVHMMALEIPDNDSLASRVGSLAGLLAEELGEVWEALDDLVCAAPDTLPGEEVP